MPGVFLPLKQLSCHGSSIALFSPHNLFFLNFIIHSLFRGFSYMQKLSAIFFVKFFHPQHIVYCILRNMQKICIFSAVARNTASTTKYMYVELSFSEVDFFYLSIHKQIESKQKGTHHFICLYVHHAPSTLNMYTTILHWLTDWFAHIQFYLPSIREWIIWAAHSEEQQNRLFASYQQSFIQLFSHFILAFCVNFPA